MSSRIDNFNRLKTIVDAETTRLGECHKSRQIKLAMAHLWQIVVKNNSVHAPFPQPQLTLEGKKVTHLEINTQLEMLDVRMSEWHMAIEPSTEQGMEFNGRREGFYPNPTLREALNIATWNIANWFGSGTWGPWWGNAASLDNVLNKIKQ